MELIIAGWRPGLKTVSLVAALCRYKGVGLKQAKQEMEDLLGGQPIQIPDMDAESLAKARAELEALGCVCQ